ncbi:hypothetical protein SAMN05443144_1114 [Fodinibius roseus]|uniref:Uncharacterized protein n=1 Tax=Fodinibius roseus TaxID=1194090 RepID=A0A1M5D5U5_9BACT|nr:hypothetical protein SAMN05443144_1114 [Fodinibius roseus]
MVAFETQEFWPRFKTRGRLPSQHIAHMQGFQPSDNADIGQKSDFEKVSHDIIWNY